MSGWGYGLMMLVNVAIWAGLIAGAVAVVRYVTRPGVHSAANPDRAPEEILALRYARGDIDQEEYSERLRVLRSHDGRP
jgi:putative membrane protein